MGRFVKIAALLAGYLVWICGTAYIDLSCHINHTCDHLSCTNCCECHHAYCDICHLEVPHSCNHDHSQKLVFCETNKRYNISIEPIALCIEAQIEDNLSIEDIPAIRKPRYYERDIPIRPWYVTTRRGMRAPPVVA